MLPFFSPPRCRMAFHAGGRKFKHAKRYTNAITREKPCDTSFAQYFAIFFSTIFAKRVKKVRKVNFIYQSFLIGATIFLRLGMNLPRPRALRKIALPRSRLIFFSRQKEGRALPNRRVDLGTNEHGAAPYIHTCTYVRTYVSYPRRFGTSDGAEKLSKTKLTWPARRTLLSCLPQPRARRMCFQHTIVNTFYLFVYTELLLSVYRWNRAAPDLLSTGRSSCWRDSKGLWELKANNTRREARLMFIAQVR